MGKREKKKKTDQRQNTRDTADTAGQRKWLHVKRKKNKRVQKSLLSIAPYSPRDLTCTMAT